MRRAVSLTTLGALAALWPLSCGSLNKGEVVIVDESAGAPSAGGVSGSAGKGGGPAGGAAGKGGASGKGGGAGDAGEAGVGTGANGGSGSGGKGGSSSGGTGGSSRGGTGGGAGEPPTDCTELSDCAGVKPICDDGTCRACVPRAMPDECAELTTTPLCDDSGRCVQCLHNGDCKGSSQSVCDAGSCRGCLEGSECDSGACNGGRCAPESSVIYALAGAGSYDMDCGTLAKPCMRLLDAAGKLSEASPNLVLIATSAKFTYENAVLPPGINVWVFGNDVTIEGFDSPILTKSGGGLYLDDVVVSANASGGTMVPGFSAVDLTSVALRMRRGAVYNNNKEYGGHGITLTDCGADVQQVEFWNAYTGLVFQGTAGLPGQVLTVERCLFQNNFQALDVNANTFTIRNNLFVANGLASYTRVIRLAGVNTSIFSYNTLYGNDNNCSYDGGLVACSTVDGCGINSSNLFWGNMFGGTAVGAEPCPDQVYPYPPTIAYTLAEQTWAGLGNIDGSLPGNDPRLANPGAGDFAPSSGSPAIDAGDTEPAVVPDVDYYGNPRPVGAAPDIGAIEVE